MEESLKIKICGLRTPEDAAAVNEVLPDYVGFVFDPTRKRYIPPETAESIRKLLDPRIRSVGVFVDAGTETILHTLAVCHLDVLQLHGQESEEDIVLLQKELEKLWRKEPENLFQDLPEEDLRRMTGIGRKVETQGKTRPVIIKAFRIDTIEDIRRAEASPADGILLDHGPGGTGERFDWSLLEHCHRPFFLAGGLTPDNVGETIRLVHPYGVDVSSSLETDGHKDPEKIRKFMAAARAAGKETT